MVLRYRQIGPDDFPDKGSHGGHCNIRACQKPGAYYYNDCTDSYYCSHCAHKLNKANRDSGRDICTYDEDGSMEQP